MIEKGACDVENAPSHVRLKGFMKAKRGPADLRPLWQKPSCVEFCPTGVLTEINLDREEKLKEENRVLT